MIRPAKFVDVPRIVELLVEMQQSGRYREIDEVDERAAHQLVAQAIQRHGGIHYGGAHVMVAEKNEIVEGFIIGMLDRIYHIGTRLAANDVFLYVSPRGRAVDCLHLLRSYIDWAETCPKVRITKLSWTDALPDAEQIERVYNSMGFRRCGGIYEREVVQAEVGVTA